MKFVKLKEHNFQVSQILQYRWYDNGPDVAGKIQVDLDTKVGIETVEVDCLPAQKEQFSLDLEE